MQDLIGRTLGYYRVVEKIGAGGMGVVYRAHDERLDRDVAIKVLPEELARNPDRLARFEREAKAVARLSHPNILDVYELGDHEGRPFIAAELLKGETLGERLDDGSLGWRKATEIGAAIADGLGAAHEAAISHRDLKPSNVFLTEDGRVKIIDFGLARFEGGEAAMDTTHAPTITQHTEPGTVLGTVGYMSPEQVRGEAVDQRSDIFSLGCVLYEMVSGQRAFVGDTAVETMNAILKEEPADISSSGEASPPELAGTIRRCLEKRPQARFQSASDLAYSLRTISTASQPSVTGRRPPRIRGLKGFGWLAISAVAIVVIAAAVGVVVDMRRGDDVTVRDTWVTVEWVAVAALENRTGDPSLDPLGQRAVDLIVQRFSDVGRVGGVLTMDAVPHTPGTGVKPRKLPRRDDAIQPIGEKGPHLLVSGSYYFDGEELEVQARLTDYDSGELLFAFKPIKTPRTDIAAALEDLRERVVTAVQFHWGREQDVRMSNPPTSYQAFLAYERGFREFGSDYGKAISAFNEALELCPDFHYTRIGLIVCYLNLGDTEQAVRELSLFEGRQEGFTHFERTAFDWITAGVKRRRAEAIAHLREMVRIAPHIPMFRYQLAWENLLLNRPAESIEAINPILPVYEAKSRPTASWALNLAISAHHMIGGYEQALEWADVGLEIFPAVGDFYAQKAGALAAMGRIEAIDSVIDHCTEVQLRDSSANVGTVMAFVALELRAHGHPRKSQKLAARAADWYERKAEGKEIEDRDLFDLRRHSWVLRIAGRWEEAKTPLMELKKRGWRPIHVAGAMGVIAVRTGDHDEARRIFDAFPDPGPPYNPAGRCYWRACIASFLGDKDVAVELLREGFANGLYHSSDHHADVDLEPLWDYPPFQELIAPKG